MTTGPVVLIVGRFDPADAEAVAPLVHHSTLPLLLRGRPRAATRWIVPPSSAGGSATIGPDADLAAAWTGAVDRGVSSGLR